LGRQVLTDEAVTPRRDPGPFHWARIGYYALDFLVGTRTLDRRAALRLRPVIYDRCGLDMAVDPARYGLRSSRGVRSLWLLARTPDSVVLLYDSPAVLFHRKPELARAEIHDQFGAWLALAEEDRIDVILPACASPDLLRAALEDLLWDRFRGKNEELANGGADRKATLRWLGNHLATAPAMIWAQSLRSASGDNAPRGGVVARFGTLPWDRRPRALIQIDAAPPDLSALLNPQRRIARAVVTMADRFLRSSRVRRHLPAALRVDGPGGAAISGEGPALLATWIAGRLGVPEVGLHVAAGTPGGHRKPVVQVVDPHGRILAYAKVGWDPGTVELVRHEEQMLRSFGELPLHSALVPVVTGSGFWQGRYVLLLEPFPRAGRDQASFELGAQHIEFLEELEKRHAGPALVRGLEIREQVAIAARELRDKGFNLEALLVGDVPGRLIADEQAVPFAPCHGDFVPWNVRRVGSRLLVVDWEDARQMAPMGYDMFHWVTQTTGLLRRESGRQVLARLGLRGRSDEAIRLFRTRADLSMTEIETLFALYLIDRLCHSIRLDGDAVNPADRRQRQLWIRLLGVLCLRRTLESGRAA
jgi:hypothetical protein